MLTEIKLLAPFYRVRKLKHWDVKTELFKSGTPTLSIHITKLLNQLGEVSPFAIIPNTLNLYFQFRNFRLFFFWLYPQHVEVPGPVTKSAPQE